MLDPRLTIDPTPIPASVLADRWGWTVDRVNAWCKSGDLPARFIKNQWFISPLALINWAEPQLQHAPTPPPTKRVRNNNQVQKQIPSQGDDPRRKRIRHTKSDMG